MQEKIIELPSRRKISLFDRKSPMFVARVSFSVSIIMALGTIVLGWLEGSLFYKANGLVAFSDVINSAILLSALSHSERSPDASFNYGYGKYESFGIFVSSSIVTLVAIYTIVEAILSFEILEPIGNYKLLVLFSVFAFFLMLRMHRMLLRAHNNFKFPILRYDSELWKNDAYIELGIITNLLLCIVLNKLGQINLARIVDSIGALALVGFAMRIPIKFGKKSIDQILDRTLPEQFHYDIISVIAENFKFLCEFRNVYARQSGKDIFVEIDVVLPYDFTLEEAFEVEKQITSKIKDMYPTALPRLYVVPCKRDCIYEQTSSCPVRKWKVKQEKT